MIVVVGRVKTDDEKRDELVRVAQAVAAASREEAGNISYRLYQDPQSENDFVIIEEWESDEALQEHFRTPHIATFMASVPATLVAPPDVKFHTISGTRDLANVSRTDRGA